MITEYYSDKVIRTINSAMSRMRDNDGEIAVELLYDAKHELEQMIRRLERDR